MAGSKMSFDGKECGKERGDKRERDRDIKRHHAVIV